MKDLKISQYSKEKISLQILSITNIRQTSNEYFVEARFMMSCNIPPNSGIAKSLVSLNKERELNEKEKAKEIIMTLSKKQTF